MRKKSIGKIDISYVTSSRAAQLSGYSQDYVGQLCRSESIECKRVAGEWHIAVPALLAYKKRFNPDRELDSISVDTKNQLPEVEQGHQETITDAGQTYISSNDAARRTGYSQDYIGQLARSGAVEAKKVGRKWFIEQDSLVQHKAHNDTLLAAVQAGASGVQTVPPEALDKDSSSKPQIHKKETSRSHAIPIVVYEQDDGTLVPSSQEARNTLLDAGVPKPEVMSMPTVAPVIKKERKDLRKVSRRQIHTTRHIPNNKDITPSIKKYVTPDTHKAKVAKIKTKSIHSISSTGMGVFSRIIVSSLVVVSLISISAALFIPEEMHEYISAKLQAMNISIHKVGIHEDGLFKDILSSFASQTQYEKGEGVSNFQN